MTETMPIHNQRKQHKLIHLASIMSTNVPIQIRVIISNKVDGPDVTEQLQ
jgi:hypothetical protein